ncbi:EcoKI restriction-modification system protein HsdS [Streptococcus parasanguinis]|uniref:restriction endonuclease subunit S n=1 Tax=Streptococcus parasanguinis TaxID=1318 RepID=UPI000FAAC641|nr:restriction endonuclease subunit S [Streptococcus parasanguinis]RSI58157.1 EcoKI restriction-modification system protein HsdS [Streptococcus parasanguinis]
MKAILPKIRFNEFENIWTKSKLGDLYEIYSGNTPSRSDNMNYQNGEIPWIKTTDLNNSIICSNEEKISVYGATKLKLLPENSVLIAMYGGFNQIGRTGLLAYPATINQALAALMPVNEINPNFLLNFLNFKKESWRNVAASSRKDPNITKNDVEKFIISFPSLEEQSAIGSLFRTLDDLLGSYKNNLSNYQSLKATMLSKLFPKAEQTVPEIRLDGFEGEWERIKLGEFCDLITKGTTAKSQSEQGKVNFVKVENLKDNEIYPIVKISEEEHLGSLKRSILCEGDILFSIAGTLGRTAIVRNNILPANTNQALAIIRGYKLDAYFLLVVLSGEVVKDYIRKNPTVGAQPNLSLEQVSSLKIQAPSMEEQQAIGSYFNNLDNLIATHQEKISQLETLKKKLLHDMFI